METHETLAFWNAQEGTRTPTPLREADFKSAASTIPPPGHINFMELIYNILAYLRL